jgi:hypothetical protein
MSSKLKKIVRKEQNKTEKFCERRCTMSSKLKKNRAKRTKQNRKVL